MCVPFGSYHVAVGLGLVSVFTRPFLRGLQGVNLLILSYMGPCLIYTIVQPVHRGRSIQPNLHRFIFRSSSNVHAPLL